MIRSRLLESGRRIAVTGNHAVALAVKLAGVQVISAYPITPQTSIVEKLAEMVESGELDAQMVRVESEHSALAVAYGAALGGARVFTATSSHGLLYMHEWVHWFSRARVPGVMAVVTRTIGPPWNIWPDHSDFMDQRDTGWIMAFAMDNQEVLDLILQAFKVSEDERVFLPFMVGLEGFVLGHTVMPVEVPGEDEVREWLGPRRQPYVVDGSQPLGVGGLTFPDETLEMQWDLHESLVRALEVFRRVDEEYGRLFGRTYGGPLQCYECDDAEVFLVTMGAWSGDAMEAIDELRREGYPVGLARVRLYRPFPRSDVRRLLSRAGLIIVFDRSVSFGSTGPLYADVAASLAGTDVRLYNVIAGLGGVDVGVRDFYKTVKRLASIAREGVLEPGSVVWYRGGDLTW